MLKDIGKIKQYFHFDASIDYSSDENELAQRYRVENFVNSSTTNQHNATDYSLHKIAVHTPIYYSLESKMNRMFLEVAPSYSRERTHDWLYHPDTLLLASQIDMLRATTDPGNSYDSELQTYKTGINLQLRRLQHLPASKIVPFESDAEFLDLYLHFTPMHERLNYQRGPLDTLVTRNTFRFCPELRIYLFAKKDRHRPALIRLYQIVNNTPLVSLLSYRDDANPLVVRLGNPNLKSYTLQSTFEAEYKDIRSARHNFYVSGFYGYLHNKVLEAVSFNPATGVYTYRPENVHGTYDIRLKGGLFYTLDKNKYWTAEANLDVLFTHWLDHAMLAGDTESQLNAVNSLTQHHNAYIQYNKGTGDIRWRHSEGKMYDFETLNAFDYRYGLSARYTLPRLNTTLSADGNMYSRRGYGSSELNTDDFVLNASISQPFLKGKLIARIEAFDLLHQLSNTQYSVNAQGRTETWYRSLPHYVMAHLVYHWNRNPKKGK